MFVNKRHLRDLWEKAPGKLPTKTDNTRRHMTRRYSINSSPPSAAYMRQWTVWALVQVMACRLFGAKPLPEPMLAYCQLDPWEQFSVKFESEFYHFHSINRSGVTLDLRTYVHLGRACRFTYAVRWSGIPIKSRHGLTYFHFPVLIWKGNAIRSSRWIE